MKCAYNIGFHTKMLEVDEDVMDNADDTDKEDEGK